MQYFLKPIILFIVLIVVPNSGSSQSIDQRELYAQLNPVDQFSVIESASEPDTDLVLPNPRVETIASQTLWGIVGGGALSLLSGFLAESTLQCSALHCKRKIFIAGASVGYIIGSSLAVYSKGNNETQKASYPVVLLGDFTGFGLGTIILTNLADHDYELKLKAGYIPVYILPIAGAIGGYYLSREPVKAEQKESIFNFSDGGSSIKIPSVSIQSLGTLSNISLVSTVSFLSIQL